MKTNNFFLIVLVLIVICLITIFLYDTGNTSVKSSLPSLSDIFCSKIINDTRNNNDKMWGGEDLSGTKSGKAFDICNSSWIGENGKSSKIINGTFNFFNMKTSNSTYSSNYKIQTDTYLYFPNEITINYIFVGGGGGGGKNSTFYNPNVQCQGGGGEGGSIVKNSTKLSIGLYKITIGVGGSIGSSGSSTILSKVDLATNNLQDIISNSLWKGLTFVIEMEYLIEI